MKSRRMRCASCCSAMSLLLFAGLCPAQVQSEEVGAETSSAFEQKGEDAPLYRVIESFFTEASDWLPYPDAFEQFCAELKIDPDWPSAKMMAQLVEPIHEEYLARVRNAMATGAWEPDPTDWKYAEIGRAFGALVTELRRDGLTLELPVLIRVIELKTRPTFTSYSDEPFDERKQAARNALMWEAMASTSEEAAELVKEGRVR